MTRSPATSPSCLTSVSSFRHTTCAPTPAALRSLTTFGQVPPEVLAYSGPRDASGATKLAQVRASAQRIKDMVDAERRAEAARVEMERRMREEAEEQRRRLAEAARREEVRGGPLCHGDHRHYYHPSHHCCRHHHVAFFSFFFIAVTTKFLTDALIDGLAGGARQGARATSAIACCFPFSLTPSAGALVRHPIRRGSAGRCGVGGGERGDERKFPPSRTRPPTEGANALRAEFAALMLPMLLLSPLLMRLSFLIIYCLYFIDVNAIPFKDIRFLIKLSVIIR